MSALSGLLVIETATRVAGEYAARLLADLGATVIKLEPPTGSPTRAMGPFVNGASTLFAWLNTNKRSAVLDLSTQTGRATLNRLLARAHALIDDHAPEQAAPLGLDRAAIAEAHPHLVHCTVTPFGQDAPEHWNEARPLNVINAGGWAWHSPSDTPADLPPLKGAGRFLSDYEAGLDAAIATLASLHRQRRTGGLNGQGKFIDLAEVQVQVNRIDGVLGRMLAGEDEPGPARTRYDMGGPGTSFACADGHVFLFVTTRVHWQGLMTLMGEPEWARAFPEDWLEFHCTPDRVARFRRHFGEYLRDQHKLEVSDRAQKLGVPLVPVNTAADLPDHDQFIHRGYFQTLADPALGGAFAFPTVPYRMSASPVRLATPAPALNADAVLLDRADA